MMLLLLAVMKVQLWAKVMLCLLSLPGKAQQKAEEVLVAVGPDAPLAGDAVVQLVQLVPAA